jgi:hypothetical protein
MTAALATARIVGARIAHAWTEVAGLISTNAAHPPRDLNFSNYSPSSKSSPEAQSYRAEAGVNVEEKGVKQFMTKTVLT